MTDDGHSTRPKSKAAMAAAPSPIRMALFRPMAEKKMMARSPARVTQTCFWLKSPISTRVSGAGRMRPPWFSPRTAMKSPMPAPIPRFRFKGMAFITASRSPERTRIRMMIPSAKTTAIPTCQGTRACWKPMTEKASMALKPIPEARARGRLVTSPIRMLTTAAPIAVAVVAAVNGTPAAARMAGLTKTM